MHILHVFTQLSASGTTGMHSRTRKESRVPLLDDLFSEQKKANTCSSRRKKSSYDGD